MIRPLSVVCVGSSLFIAEEIRSICKNLFPNKTLSFVFPKISNLIFFLKAFSIDK